VKDILGIGGLVLFLSGMIAPISFFAERGLIVFLVNTALWFGVSSVGVLVALRSFDVDTDVSFWVGFLFAYFSNQADFFGFLHGYFWLCVAAVAGNIVALSFIGYWALIYFRGREGAYEYLRSRLPSLRYWRSRRKRNKSI